MSRPRRLALLFAFALVGVAFVPLFVERAALRSTTMGGAESVRYVWVLDTLFGVWDQSSPWRAFNVLLASLYALLVAAGALRVWDWARARQASGARSGPPRHRRSERYHGGV